MNRIDRVDKLQELRDEIGNDPEKALAALEKVAEWINKELPIPTQSATVMLVRISAAISVLKSQRQGCPIHPNPCDMVGTQLIQHSDCILSTRRIY